MSTARARHRVATFLAPLRGRQYRQLWLSQVASETGDWAARLALASLVYSRTGSATWTALVFVSGLIPMLGPGQLLATLADAWGRRAVMVGADLVRAAVFAVLALPVDLPMPALLAMSILAGLATAPFEAARAAAVIEVSKDDLSAAVSLTHATQDLAVLGGYAVGGSLLALVGPNIALALNSASFLGSAVILSLLPRLRPAQSGEKSGKAARTLLAAAGTLWHDKVIRRFTALATLAVGTGSALDALIVPLTDRAHVGWLAGPVLAGVAAVSLVLTLMLGSSRGVPDLLWITAWATFAPSVVCMVALLTGWLPVQVLGLLTTGGLYVTLVAAGIVVGPRMPDTQRATCFSVLGGVLTATQVALSAVGGQLADALSPATAGAALLLVPTTAAVWHWIRPLPPPARWSELGYRGRSTLASSQTGSLAS